MGQEKLDMIENGTLYSGINYLGELHLEPAYSLAAVNLLEIFVPLGIALDASIYTYRLNV